jgi:hypothetical protein
MKLGATARQNSRLRELLPACLCYEYQNKGLNFKWGHLFPLSAMLAYVYENIVATDFDLVAIDADGGIHG